MKGTILIGLGVIAIALLVVGCGTTQKSQDNPTQQLPSRQTMQVPSETTQTHDIEIKNFEFNPAEITIKQGDAVVWINQDDTRHSAKFTFEESKLLGKGESFSYTFNEKGVFEYECGPHPFMKGKITVI